MLIQEAMGSRVSLQRPAERQTLIHWMSKRLYVLCTCMRVKGCEGDGLGYFENLFEQLFRPRALILQTSVSGVKQAPKIRYTNLCIKWSFR